MRITKKPNTSRRTARVLDPDEYVRAAILRATRDGVAITATHGGSVANSYGYPATTDAVGVVAVRRGPLIRARWVHATMSANKATRAGAATRTLGDWARPIYDPRYGAARTAAAHESAATAHIAGADTATGIVRPDGTVRMRCGAIVVPIPCAYPSDACMRAYARMLRAHGYRVVLARQTPTEIAEGSIRHNPDGRLRLLVADRHGAVCHIHADGLSRPDEAIRAADAALATLRRRSVTDRAAALDAVITAMGDRIWVTRSDSLAAGHCQAGTDAGATEIERALGAIGTVGAITAAALLAIRHDDFARRAARVAAMRYRDR